MKNYLLVMAVLFSLCSGAQNPRYFTGSPLLCPIDYNTLGSTLGLQNTANQSALRISNSGNRAVTRFLDATGANATVYEPVKDTSFLITKIAKKGFAFEVVQELGSYSLVKYWELKKGRKKADTALPFLTTLAGKSPFSVVTKENIYKENGQEINDTKDYYLIRNNDLNKYSKEFEYKKHKWSMGLLVLPVKLRVFADTTGQFEFSDGFSLGTTFSWTYNHKWVNDKTYNLVLYTGISSISTDSIKTRGATNATKIPAFSPAIGVMIEKGGIQIGGFIGWDFPLGNIQRNWVYRNRPWFGVGLGFSIFKIQNPSNTETGNNN